MDTRINRTWVKVGTARIAVDMIAAFESHYTGEANRPDTKVYFAGQHIIVPITPMEFEDLIVATNP